MFRKIAIWFSVLLCMFLTGCTNKQTENNVENITVNEDVVVSYLGPEGTYTQEAAQLFFSDKASLIPCTSVIDAMNDVVEGKSDYAVIPQENTIGGSTSYVDTLMNYKDLYVVGEVIIPINQTLMGIEGTTLNDIKTVCSHTQGIAQSEAWRKENLPDAQIQEMDSTAAAAKYVAETKDKSIAAIAAPGAAKLYGLSVIAENVQITDTNKTRFYVLSLNPLKPEGHRYAVFVAECKASTIDDIIVMIHQSGLELVTIHDRPAGDELGSYRYIIEVEKETGIDSKIIDKISSNEYIRYLGSFDVVE